MNLPKQDFWTQLLQAQVVEGEMPVSDTLESPWYIKVLLGFSGWIAALFFLGFTALAAEVLWKNAAAALTVGSLMVGGAFALLRIPKNKFLEHMAFAISLAGQAWIIFSFFKVLEESWASIFMLIGLLQLFLVVAMPNFVHRVFSTFGATVAFSITLIHLNIPYLFTSVTMLAIVWLSLHEFHYPQHIRTMQAVIYGLILAVVPLHGSSRFGTHLLEWSLYNRTEPWVQAWMGELLTGLVTVYLVAQLLLRFYPNLFTRTPLLILAGTLLICIVSLEAGGLTIGFVILLLGYARSNRLLMGMGVIALLFYISSYYYLLNTTLLNKSISLLVIGIVLLTLRGLMLKWMPLPQETQDV
jgi:uncharacterized membrane protein